MADLGREELMVATPHEILTGSYHDSEPDDHTVVAVRRICRATVVYDVSGSDADEHGHDGVGDWVFRPVAATVNLMRRGERGHGKWEIESILVRGKSEYVDRTVGGRGPDMRYFGSIGDKATLNYSPSNIDRWRPWRAIAADAVDAVRGQN
jgi:hypothetical protein